MIGRQSRIHRPICAAAAFLCAMLLTELAAAACADDSELRNATPNELFDSATSCDDLERAVLTMLIGQVRAQTDMAVFPAATEADENIMGELAMRLYYHMGGSGPDSVYRDEALYRQIVADLDQWSPGDLLPYEPGWAYSSAPSYAGYFASIEAGKRNRLAQLEWYFGLVSNDEYYDLKVQADEILRRNNNQLVAGTADAIEYGKLADRMNAVKAKIRQQTQD